ncbi:unnamed protein product [Camellia sinensis]
MADAEEKFLSYFPNDFKEYTYKELNWLPSKYFNGGVFWSREDDEPQRPFTLPDGDISNLNKIIRDLLYRTTDSWPYGPNLVQFWAPITKNEGRSFLTTRNQPFSLITSFYNGLGIDGLCGYRMICMDSKFDIDLDGGRTCEQHLPLPGRVFKHQFPESTPNVEFYSITEYPQRDDALRCGVRESLAFPVFEPSTQRCVGVIEVVTLEDDLIIPICERLIRYGIYEDFEMKGLKCPIGFDHKDMELDEAQNEARTVALDEIKNVLKVVCDVYDLPLAQAWVPCKVGWPCRPLVDGGILGVSCYYYKHEDKRRDFQDVTQLSLTKYPLAHYARKYGLSGCFAICLQSSCTKNDDYVLEFFLPVSNETNENPHASLKKILKTMRKDFRTLRVASRKELGEDFCIEEIGGDLLDDLLFAQPLASIVHTEPHDTTMQDANVVTIKAKYAKGNAIKFRLSLSSRLIELQQEVAQRLNLEAGTYYVKYKDEDGDLILIACDGDLRDYVCISRLEGKTCIVVLLVPKLPITDHL